MKNNMSTTKNNVERSAFGKIVSMTRLDDEKSSMLITVSVDIFFPSPKLYVNTRIIEIIFSTSGSISFNSDNPKYEDECMFMIKKYSDEDIKLKSNKIAEKYFIGKIINDIVVDIYGKSSIIFPYLVRI